MKKVIIASMLLFLLPTTILFAQEDSGRIPITAENVGQLSLAAILPSASDNNLAWSPDGRLLASESQVANQIEITVWDAETWEAVQHFMGHSGDIRQLTWSADGRFLMSAGSGLDRTVRIWDVENGVQHQEITETSGSGTWSVEGNLLAVTSTDLKIWDVETDEILYETPLRLGETPAPCTAWSPDGRYFMGGLNTDDGLMMRIWDVETWEVAVDLPTWFRCAIWSADSTELAAVLPESIWIWDVETWSVARTIEPLNTRLSYVGWSADNSIFATGSTDNGVILFEGQNPDSPAPLHGIPEPYDFTVEEEIRLSVDGGLLAAPAAVDKIVIWDTSTSLIAHVLDTNESPNVRLAWSPDGTLLASATSDGQVLVWGVSGE